MKKFKEFMKKLGSTIKKYGSLIWLKIWSLLKIAFTNKVFRWFFIFMIPIILLVIVIVIVFIHYSPQLPSLSQLEQINPKLVTNIYDKDGQIAHKYFVERREWTSIDSIPLKAIQAVMATEDRAFYKHWGMNVWAIPSALIESIRSGNKLRGASTLTQQLTKLLFLTPERTISRKIKEMMTAIRIEQTYTKEEIHALLKRLCALGAKKAALTGISYKENEIGVEMYDSETGEFFSYFGEKYPVSFHGTGDIFSSAVVGVYCRGKSLEEALKIAVDYTAECIRLTLDDPDHRTYGVNFEEAIPFLVNLLSFGKRK
jgi:hypothetical protein